MTEDERIKYYAELSRLQNQINGVLDMALAGNPKALREAQAMANNRFENHRRRLRRERWFISKSSD